MLSDLSDGDTEEIWTTWDTPDTASTDVIKQVTFSLRLLTENMGIEII